MTNYCSSAITFSGAGAEAALAHFAQMGTNQPPFEEIIIDGQRVLFESRWAPPYMDLEKIAEQFDANFHLAYRLPYHPIVKSFDYLCCRDRNLRPAAHGLRNEILYSNKPTGLEGIRTSVHSLSEMGVFDANERRILQYLIEKRTQALQQEPPQEERSRGRGR